MNRRSLILAGASPLLLPALGATALAPEARGNPMPEELRKSLARDPTAPVLGNPTATAP